MFFRLAGLTLAILVSAGFSIHPALASTVVVPDEAPTVQFAIDTGADTVLIQEGSYPERPVVDRAVVIQGIGINRRPRLDGLHIYNTNFWTAPKALSVADVDFSGRVAYTTVYYRPRLITLSFSQCALDSGFQAVIQGADDILLLAIRNSRLQVASMAHIDQVLMEADTVEGGVAWRSSRAWIRDCWFRGGLGTAIELAGYPQGGSTAGNRLENYQTAIYGENLEGHVFEGNTILRCGSGILMNQVSEVSIVGNEIRECLVGVEVHSGWGLDFSRNRIIGATGPGAWLDFVYGRGLLATNNVIGSCGGHGMIIDEPEAAVLRGNTIFNNGGSGVVVSRVLVDPTVIENNIIFGNGGWGMSVPPWSIVQLGCNDWFGNTLGAVEGAAADSSDHTVDPLFCGVDSEDLTLNSASPLVGATACGQIGALGVGCGVTTTLVRRFAAQRVREGIRVIWEVAEGGTATQIWAERAEGMESEGWSRPLTERSTEARSVIELDRSAVSDRAYRYRLAALEEGEVVILGPGIVVEAEERAEFRLMEVGPSPSGGPVQIVFALSSASVIEIDVYDMHGRRVAQISRGAWSAGRHVVAWDGVGRNGRPVPAGVYLLQYVYPGGRAHRNLVRLR